MDLSIDILDKEKISEIRSIWLDGIEDEDAANLTNSTFENILSNHSYGDFLKRPSLNTYISVIDSTTNSCLAIAEVIISIQGRETICKIMDIFHSPWINALEDEQYISQSIEILVTLLTEMLAVNKLNSRGHTKIYSPSQGARLTMNLLHDNIDKNQLEAQGFTVKPAGRDWLLFEKIS